MKLQHLTNSQIKEIEDRFPHINLDRCPTCLSTRDEDGIFEGGKYRFNNEEFDCDCDKQVILQKHYLLANIPIQYHSLDWDRDYSGSSVATDAVRAYLDKWSGNKRYGQGLEFGGVAQGIGKTFAATTIGKELIKRGESVYFAPFNQLLNAMRYEDERMIANLDKASVLILDELQPPPNEKLIRIMSDRFESIIRDRTNYNLITILTTNMSKEDIQTHYKRSYSLLSAKQERVQWTGADARASVVLRDKELIANNECRPIS